MSRTTETLDRLGVPHVLREYALLADGERGIVVGPRGDFQWMCFPRWHSDACFAALVGGGGVYSVTPRDRFVWGGYYELGLIWHSRWITDDGVIECQEALALPATPSRAVILRRVVAIEGAARLEVVLDVRARYGTETAKRLRHDDDVTWTAELPDLQMALTGAADAEPTPDGHGGRPLTMELHLPEGTTHDLVLVLDADRDGDQAPDADTAWAATRNAWSQRLPELPDLPAARDARHAYAVMQGLTSASGGMVAAATTSLPERAGEGRNYDYRYVWIRDQCFAGQAAAAAGPLPLMDDSVSFVAERLLDDGPGLSPAYTVAGDRVPDETTLDLPGYPGGFDKIGNHVNEQFQLDGFGEALLLLASAADHDHLNAEHWRAAEIAVRGIEERWREVDAGVWELHPDAWTHSRLICAAGLRRIAAHQPTDRAAPWLSLADALVADTAEHALHPSGRWQRSPSDPRVDAALLLPALRGAVPADDPRTLATLQAVASELCQDGYCYRFAPDDRPLGEAEGAFLMCGFVMSLAYHQQGEQVAATAWFERNRTACGPPGLLTEEYDVRQRQLRGNLPQAFVHALLFECAVAMIHSRGG
ncbi:MAG TPA: glycoside hydrolase family 15 protein [Solirubrobacteraceae bacterium]|nr:glycoside hydrolase family 15 protein [Solirubrobacteraceae bacterium]